MFRPPTSTAVRHRPRRGTILIVVLALLALFAVIGISFVFYSSSEATAARIHREGQGQGGSDTTPPDADAAINSFLGAFTYGPADTDILNTLRGHDLARGEFGWGGVVGQSNTPYSGVGTFHETTPLGIDRAQWVNYTPIMNGGTATLLDPEWTGSRTGGSLTTGAPNVGAPPAGRTYIPKNALYTYPDANNLFLAALSPATGEVLVPSFYREWIFGGLASTNANWTSPQGRAMILRPRPIDQLNTAAGETAANLPSLIADGKVINYPPVNADGTVTGDVQNLPGGVGVQKPDSILMDIGLEKIRWNNKWIKPLVAVLVTDLDSCLNLNAHGNLANGGNHASYAGYGPWEVNLGQVLSVGDAQAIVAGRQFGTTALSRGGLNTLAYDRSGAHLPAYSLVNWRGDGTPNTPTITFPAFPAPGAFQTSPTFGGTGFFDDNGTSTTKAPGHPGLWNPNEWADAPSTTPTTAFTFPLSDLRRLRAGYARTLDSYQQMALARTSPTLYPTGYNPPNAGLVGTSAMGNGYRLDLAHANRLLFTTRSAGLDRPGLMPNFPSSPTGSLQLAPNTLHPTSAAFSGTYSTSIVAAPAVGTVDLNRTLTDYRIDPTKPLGPTNLDATPGTGNAAKAWADRHNLARDIFARLVVATGANATVDPATGNVTILAGTTEQTNALRYLAQIAANAVDTIDSDDVSTVFVWSPNGGTLAAVTAQDVQTTAAAVTTIEDHIVFGIEKPRLVINEAYGELTNNPAEMLKAMANSPPTQNLTARFWVELLNPTSPAYAAGAGPLGDTAATPRTDGSVALFNGAGSTVPSPYQLVITRAVKGTTNAADYLRDPINVTGGVPSGFTPDITFDFTTAPAAGLAVQPNAGTYSQLTQAPAVATQGFVLVAPQKYATRNMDGSAAPKPIEFDVDTTTAPYNTPGSVVVGTAFAPNITTAMEYDLGSLPPTTQLENDTAATPSVMRALRRHVVLLRRLANPYLPPDPKTNPYITVDSMDWVPAFDAVARGISDTGPKNRVPKTAAGPNQPGFDPADNTTPAIRRYAVGKVQPYAGFASGNANATTDLTTGGGTWPTLNTFTAGSFVVAQNPATTPVDGQPKHTFLRHNGTQDAATNYTAAANTLPTVTTETIMAPFDWLVHFDRPLVNSLELIGLQAVKPHELTQYTLQPPLAPATVVRRGMGQVPWFGVNTGSTPVNQPYFDATTGYPTATAAGQTNNGLFRALDLLRVKPWGYGVGLGGRVHGRININTSQDLRVFRALLDPQAGNSFSQGQDDVLTAWSQAINPTSPVAGVPYRTYNTKQVTLANGTTMNVPVPGRTYDDDPTYANADRPFKPFTVGEFAAGGTTAAVTGSGLQDTLLRTDATGKPLLWSPNPNATHPYLQSEMARKLLNNVTTVSNTFAVTVTVVFHEVRTDGSGNPLAVTEGGVNRYLLGKEAYLDVPGDLRKQYFAVVDRSNIGFVPGTTTIQTQPFFTSLEAPAAAGATTITIAGAADSAGQPAVYADGVPVAIQGSTLSIGVGATAETRTAGAVTPGATPGTYVVTIPGLIYPHASGESVSNIVPGNPGPQPGFDRVNNTNSDYRSVVPYIVRVGR